MDPETPTQAAVTPDALAAIEAQFNAALQQIVAILPPQQQVLGTVALVSLQGVEATVNLILGLIKAQQAQRQTAPPATRPS